MMSKKEDDIESCAEGAINAEVEWGRTYRHQKKEGRKVSISPVTSPFNMKKLWEQYQISKEIREIKELKRKLRKRPIEITQKQLKGRVDPDIVSKKTYYNYMSTPRYHPDPPPPPPKLPKLDKKECSPRLIYLSQPTKRRVLHTWKDHRCSLPIDFIARLEELLQANHNLDPEFARCYFKNLDRAKKRERMKLKRRIKKKKRKQIIEARKWLQVQVKMTAGLLVKFLKKESLFSLNFKQMMISEAILDEVHKHNHIKKIPPRNSSKPYSRAVIDIADQLSVWVDTIMRYVDVQYTDSVEGIVEVSSLTSGLGEEEEGEEEGEDSPHRFSLPPLPPLPDMPPLSEIEDLPFIIEQGEDGIVEGAGADALFQGYPADKSVTEDTQLESQATIDESSLQEDALQSLIDILSYSSPELLRQLVDPNTFPEVTYDEVLGKLRVMKDKTEVKRKEERAAVLEKIMTEWANSNSPERVNEPVVEKIHSAAGILSECLGKERQMSLPPAYIDMRSASEGVLATGDVSYPTETTEEEGKDLTTLPEEEISSVTSKGELSQFGDDDISTIGKYIGAKQSKIQLPYLSSNASRVNEEPTYELHVPAPTTSDLKIVLKEGEVPSPEMSYVLRLSPKRSADTGVMSLDDVGVPPTSVSASTPPAPDSPRVPTPPEAPGSPKVSTPPDEPGSPRVPTPPDVPGSPRVSTPPEAPGSPRVSTPPDAPGSPRVSTPTGVPSSPRVSIPTGAPGSPRVSTPTGVPGSPRVSTPRVSTPSGPCTPRVSTPTSVPGSPRVSTPTRIPGSPRVSTPPCAIASPRVSTPPCATGSLRTSIPPCAIPSSRLTSLQPYGGLQTGLSRPSMPGMIPAHMPSKVFEHQPDTICCLTLKVWATWLLEVAHNAHAWSRWLNDIINEVRRIASVIRGEVKDDYGNPVVFYREDWIEFSEKIDNMIVSWRQYSMHVKDLTDKIVRNFRGKSVTCCPKCLEDNLIVDAALAHNISQQLAEAMNTAGYWRRWLDSVVMETKRLTGATLLDHEPQLSSYGTMEIIELHDAHVARSEESLYEIDEIDPCN